jgi:hypothetical protein
MKTWTKEMLQQLTTMHLFKSYKEIALELGVSHEAVKSKAQKLGFCKRKFWTTEEITYLKKNYPDVNTSLIAAHLKKSMRSVFGQVNKLGLQKSEAFRNSPLSGRIRPETSIGGNTRFKKGNVPVNKGLKQTDYMSQQAIERTIKTRFKKGLKPHNTKEKDGVITVRKDKRGKNYQWIRIREGYWRELHRVTWEQHHGKPPKGFNVQFRDGNTMNCSIENLYLINRQEQMRENTINRYPVEVKKTIRTLGRLKRKIKSYEKQN